MHFGKNSSWAARERCTNGHENDDFDTKTTSMFKLFVVKILSCFNVLVIACF